MTVNLDQEDFEYLRETRRDLVEICRLHEASVLWFKHPDRCWFRVQSDEKAQDGADDLRHLSSTASAFESLALSGMAEEELTTLVDDFAKLALAAPDSRWVSERGARIYCRVRTLPAILQNASGSLVQANEKRILRLLRYVWQRVDLNQPDWLAVAEQPDANSRLRTQGGYPPNAFHTFWAMRCLDEFEERADVPVSTELSKKRVVASLWTKRTLGMQAALIGKGAEPVDANQLGWSLAAQFLKSPEPRLTRESAQLELYRAALDAFFKEQLPSGGWSLYRPIFHYPEAGNAYCYTFETLTEMLRPALHATEGKILRDLLRPYVRDLVRAFRFAIDTQIELAPGCYGWCSGHHPHRTAAEGWATASVFSFFQVLRRLVACWTRDLASTALGVRLPSAPTPLAAAEKVVERGDTWVNPDDHKHWATSRRIAAMFIHPVEARPPASLELDPDQPLLDASQARSAVLYGPPGTSKSTIVDALAGAIGWNYLEIQASDFLADGMDRVPSRADAIFKHIMELDRCVVFFDEIDELLRERSAGSDPFGRFLTTSMLPKVATLWDQKRVLFFVATNDIARADSAIIRSQRFDALLFAAPPSFHAKMSYLHELTAESPPNLTWQAVTNALKGDFKDGDSLGVFALLRYDQIPEFVQRLEERVASPSSPADATTAVLAEMGNTLRDSEWHRTTSKENGHEEIVDLYDVFREFQSKERRDYRMQQLMRVPSDWVEPPSWCSEAVVGAQGQRFQLITGAVGSDVIDAESGLWRVEVDGKTFVDDGLLNFTEQVGAEGATA